MSRIRQLILYAVVCSIALTLAALVQFGLLAPLKIAIVDGDRYTPALGLTHGVRILAAWCLGWWSVLALAPSVALVNSVGLQTSPMLPSYPAAAAVHLITGPLAFSLLRRVWPELGTTSLPTGDGTPQWRGIMLAGALSALLNALALMALELAPAGWTPRWFAAQVITQVLGLFFVLLLLLWALRGLGGLLRRFDP